MADTWEAHSPSPSAQSRYARRLAAGDDPKVQARIRDEENTGVNTHFEAAGTTGGNTYRCTRGGCGADIGHPVNQDAHNHAEHLSWPANDDVYGEYHTEPAPERTPEEDDFYGEYT